MLTITDFEKRYHDTLVLSIPEVGFDGGLHWIKGANGSGKSTLFKSIAGLLPFKGTIALNDINLKTDPITYRRLVNYGEAEPLFPDFLTAKDLIRFIGKTKNAQKIQEEELIDIFNITPFLENPCGTYSSGMMKKVSLALAFLGDPKLIILDEPLITLDDATRDILIKIVQSHIEKKRVTFLVSSHQLLETSLYTTQQYSIINKTIQRG